MILKPDNQLEVAMATDYAGLTSERKQQIIDTIRATRPGKLNELHAVFTLPEPQGLPATERPFYDAIVTLSGDEPTETGLSPEELMSVTELANPQSPDTLAQVEAGLRSLRAIRVSAVKKAQEELEELDARLAQLASITGSASAPTPVNGKPARSKPFTPGATSSPTTDAPSA